MSSKNDNNRKKINPSKLLVLITSVIVCEAIGIFGSLFTRQTVPTWYTLLNKPTFTPPNWLFGPVWTILYALMGVSLFLILIQDHKQKKIALALFGIQLALNAVWTPLFFVLKNPLFALLDIIALWIAILFTMYFFEKISTRATLLLIPYFIWISFATALNYMIVVLN